MKRRNKPSRKPYHLDSEKFFTTEERKAILKTTEEKAIVDLAKGRQTWPVRWMLVHLVFYTGLRVAEIADLTMQDIKHREKDVYYLMVQSGKRNKSREVYIDAELIKHLHAFTEYKRLLNQSVNPEAPLFAGRGGNKCTTTTLHLSFKEAVKAAGLRSDLSIHGGRHTYASLLYQRTENLKMVQRQLGHSSAAMTLLYADILPEERGRLANMILDDE